MESACQSPTVLGLGCRVYDNYTVLRRLGDVREINQKNARLSNAASQFLVPQPLRVNAACNPDRPRQSGTDRRDTEVLGHRRAPPSNPGRFNHERRKQGS